MVVSVIWGAKGSGERPGGGRACAEVARVGSPTRSAVGLRADSQSPRLSKGQITSVAPSPCTHTHTHTHAPTHLVPSTLVAQHRELVSGVTARGLPAPPPVAAAAPPPWWCRARQVLQQCLQQVWSRAWRTTTARTGARRRGCGSQTTGRRRRIRGTRGSPPGTTSAPAWRAPGSRAAEARRGRPVHWSLPRGTR